MTEEREREREREREIRKINMIEEAGEEFRWPEICGLLAERVERKD